MKVVSLSDICYMNMHFEISDIFHENWKQRKDFSLYKNRARPWSALFFVCSADAEVTFCLADGSAKITAKKGDAVFIPKGSLYYVIVGGKVSENSYTYTVNVDLFDEAGEEMFLSERIAVLSSQRDNRCELHLKSISDAFHSIHDMSSDGMRNMAKIKGEFFILLDSAASAVAQNDEYLYPIKNGAEALCGEWQKNERIEKYAQISGVSVTYFYRCFRKWSGKSPIEYRNMLRLSNAESLLRSTDMKIQEISDAVGFEDPFYFCRMFTSVYGCSPTRYRKQYQSFGRTERSNDDR